MERIRRVALDTLQISFTLDDPKAYTKPWTTLPQTFKLRPSYELTEEFSVPDDNSSPRKAAALPSGSDK